MQAKTKFRKVTDDGEITQMFNAMVGCGEPDPTIAVPKYKSLLKSLGTICKLLQNILAAPVHQVFQEDFTASWAQLKKWTEGCNTFLEKMKLEKNDNILTGKELDKINANINNILDYINNMEGEYKLANFGEKYKKLKESEFAQAAVMTARRIRDALKAEQERSGLAALDLGDRTALRDDFITNSSGDSLMLFSFCNLDFKLIFISEKCDAPMRAYLRLSLYIMYNECMKVVKELTSPDIDKDKFAQKLVESIDSLSSHIPRCGDAFSAIRDSVHLLRDNFDSYYKKFVTSQSHSPVIIIESFLGDVANSTEGNPQLKIQVRKIVEYYRSKVQERGIKDPRVTKLMDMICENMDLMD